MATTKAACSVPLREAAQKVERLVQAPGLRLPVLGARRLDELGCVPLSRCRSGLLLQADMEVAHVSDAQRFEQHGAGERHQVEPDMRFVLVVRAEPPPRLDDGATGQRANRLRSASVSQADVPSREEGSCCQTCAVRSAPQPRAQRRRPSRRSVM